jgi:HD superfamily phosphodiesterase
MDSTMISSPLTLDDIIQMTRQTGENWAVAHAQRLIELTKQIGADLPHDPYILELAAYLHDWGAK